MAPIKFKEIWWKADKDSVADALFGLLEFLEGQDSVRHAANLHHLRMYSNRMATSLTGRNFADSVDSGERIKLNVIKSAIDASVAQVATNRPRPMFLTENGNYEQRRKAERLGRFAHGQFHKLRQYEMSLDIFRDAAVFGTAFEHVFHDGNGRVCIERVLSDEILVDPNECRTGAPRQLFRVKTVSKNSLAYRFPKYKALIEKAECLDIEYINRPAGLDDPCTVVEAWRLPSGPEADDGRHVICVDSGVLLDEVHDEQCFPLVSFRWNTAPIGYFGVGAAEEISPIQVEINYIAQKIQKLMALATSMVWKEKGSYSGKITNEDFAVREFTGRPPMFQTTSSVSSEYFNHLDRLYNRAYELVGVSQLAASSKKPGGLDSGEALRVYNDIGTKRFQHIGQRWEQFHMDIAERIVDVAREIREAGFDQEVLAMGDKDVERLDFREVDLDREAYVMKVHPISIIPDTPAGKIETMQKLAQMAPGLSTYLVATLSGIPDLEAAAKQENAPLELAQMLVGQIIEHGKYEPPTPYMNLSLTRDVATRSLLRAKIDGVSDERQALLRRFIDAVDALQAPPPQAAMPNTLPVAGQPVPNLLVPGAGPMTPVVPPPPGPGPVPGLPMN